jgi:hypothetical protein
MTVKVIKQQQNKNVNYFIQKFGLLLICFAKSKPVRKEGYHFVVRKMRDANCHTKS